MTNPDPGNLVRQDKGNDTSPHQSNTDQSDTDLFDEVLAELTHTSHDTAGGGKFRHVAPFTRADGASTLTARREADRVRATWLLTLAEHKITPHDLFRAASDPSLTGPLRQLRLDTILRDYHGYRRNSQAHPQLAALLHTTHPGAQFDKHTHPRLMTVGWLLSATCRGRRIRAWVDRDATIWPGYPFTPPPEGPVPAEGSVT